MPDFALAFALARSDVVTTFISSGFCPKIPRPEFISINRAKAAILVNHQCTFFRSHATKIWIETQNGFGQRLSICQNYTSVDPKQFTVSKFRLKPLILIAEYFVLDAAPHQPTPTPPT